VVVAVNDGDPNANPIVLGFVHNAGGDEAPTALLGLPVLEAVMTANHVLATPHGLLAEIDGLVRVKAASHLLEGAAISLAGQVGLGVSVAPDGTVVPAVDALLKGTTLVANGFQPLMVALNTYVAAVYTAIAGIPGSAPVLPALAAANVAFVQATTAFMITAQASLSQKASTS
jgi:hypothetical protein